MTLIDKAEAHDDDLIRRGDVLREIAGEGLHILDAAIRAIPARGVGVKQIRRIVEDESLEWAGLREGVLFQRVPDKIDAALTPTDTAPRRYMGQIMAECDCPRQVECEAAQKCLAETTHVILESVVQAREAAMQELIDAYSDIIDYGPLVLARKDQWARVNAAKEKLK